MIEQELKSLNLLSLEWEYSKTLSEIQRIKKSIIDMLNFQVTIENENDNDKFVWNIKKSIKSLEKEITESDLSKELSEKNNHLKSVIKELETRRKEIFDNFDPNFIPLDKLSAIDSFLSDYQKSEYREKKSKQINLAKIVEKQFNINTPLKNLDFSTRSLNCCTAADIETLWDLVRLYQEEWENALLKFRNFWKKSIKEIQEFLREYKFIE